MIQTSALALQKTQHPQSITFVYIDDLPAQLGVYHVSQLQLQIALLATHGTQM